MPVFGVPTCSRTRSLIGATSWPGAGSSSRLSARLSTRRAARPAIRRRRRPGGPASAAAARPGHPRQGSHRPGGRAGPAGPAPRASRGARRVRRAAGRARRASRGRSTVAQQLRAPRRGDQEAERAGGPPGQLGRVGGHVGQHGEAAYADDLGDPRRVEDHPDLVGATELGRPPGRRWRPGRRARGSRPRRRIPVQKSAQSTPPSVKHARRPVVGDHRGQVGARPPRRPRRGHPAAGPARPARPASASASHGSPASR